MGVPYTFATATTSIPLSQLDANFNTPVTIGTSTVGLGNTTTSLVGLSNVSTTIVGSTGNLTIQSGSTNNAILNTFGYFGVGINPSYPLDVYASQTSTYTAGTSASPLIRIFNSASGATNLPAMIQYQTRTGDSSGSLWNVGAVAGSGSYQSSFVLQYQTGSGSYAESARFAQDGSLSVAGAGTFGNTMTTNVNGPNYSGNNYASSGSSTFMNMYLSGTQQFYITNAGTIYTRGSTTIQSISDQSLKTNVVDIPYGLSTILDLKPRQFDWKQGQGNNKSGALGFIAQEVNSVLPQITDTFGDSGLMTLGTTDLIPVLVKAIQEQQEIIEQLKAKVGL